LPSYVDEQIEIIQPPHFSQSQSTLLRVNMYFLQTQQSSGSLALLHRSKQSAPK
jgi:hypothetical protein